MVVDITVNEMIMTITREDVTHSYKMRKGFRYLAELFINARDNVPFTFLNEKLECTEFGVNKKINDAKMYALTEDYYQDYSTALRMKLVDGKTIANCGNDLRILQGQLDKARKMNDYGRIEELSNEMIAINDYIVKSFNPQTRKVKTFKDEFNKYTHSIYVAINRAFKEIRANDPELAWALKKSVKIAYVSSYQPIIGLRLFVKDLRKPSEKAECMELIYREKMKARELAQKRIKLEKEANNVS